MTILRDPGLEWRLQVQQGKIDGYSVVNKFGINPLVTTATDPEDVWEGGDTYTYDADNTAPIVSVASDNAGDTQDIRIQGLDINGNLNSQTVTLSGTTRVALTTALWRVFRMENEGSTDLAGTIFCYTGTGTVPTIGDPEVRAIISNGNNQTLMALYTIPLGYVGFLFRGEIGIEADVAFTAGGEYARAGYFSRRYGKVFKIKKSISLINNGVSNYQDLRSFPDIIPALTDIKIVVQKVSTDMGIWSTFDILLVDEDKLDSSFLTAIGQPSST